MTFRGQLIQESETDKFELQFSLFQRISQVELLSKQVYVELVSETFPDQFQMVKFALTTLKEPVESFLRLKSILLILEWLQINLKISLGMLLKG